MLPSSSACISSGLVGLSSELVEPLVTMPFTGYGCCAHWFTFKFGQKNTQRCPNGSPGCQLYSTLPYLLMMIRASYSWQDDDAFLAYCFFGKRMPKCLGTNYRLKIAESPLGAGGKPRPLVWARGKHLSLTGRSGPLLHILRGLRGIYGFWIYNVST